MMLTSRSVVVGALSIFVAAPALGAGPSECFLDPPCSGTPEGEPCIPPGQPDNFNAGCNSTPPAFSEIAIDETVCGTNWADNGSRDTDWWRFSTTIQQQYAIEVRAEADTVAFIAQMSAGGVCPVQSIPPGTPAYSGDCDTVHQIGDDYVLDPGDYIIFVATGNSDGSSVTDGFPCPDGTLTNNAYALTICRPPLPAPPAPWDLSGNCIVDFADLLIVIGDWGPCPTAATAPAMSTAGPRDLSERRGDEETPSLRTTRGRGDERAEHALDPRHLLARRPRSSSAVQTTTAGGGDEPGTGPVITGAQILAGPVEFSGDTSDNTDFFDVGPLTNPPTDCGAGSAPDAWYTIEVDVATGPIAVDIDLCDTASGGGGTLYDSKIFVLDATNTPLQCNDESGCANPGAGPSTIINLQLDPGVYELAVDGFGTSAGAYAGEVRLFGPLSCFLDPPCTGTPEGEVCGGDINGGCNNDPAAFSTISFGETVCGINWADNGTRDTDWWRFDTTALTALEIEVRAETDTMSFLGELGPGGACPVIGIPQGNVAFSGDCDSEHEIGDGYVIAPGAYFVFVAVGDPLGSGIFDGFPCPNGSTTNNAYEVELRSVPLPPPPCTSDLSENGQVDFADLLQILNNWGPIPCEPPSCF